MVPVAEPAGSEIRTITVSTGPVWCTCPDQVPVSVAGARAEGRGVGSLVAPVWVVPVVAPPGWADEPCGRTKMKTAPAAIASTHTAQATLHRTTPERDRADAGGRWAGPISGILA